MLGCGLLLGLGAHAGPGLWPARPLRLARLVPGLLLRRRMVVLICIVFAIFLLLTQHVSLHVHRQAEDIDTGTIASSWVARLLAVRVRA